MKKKIRRQKVNFPVRTCQCKNEPSRFAKLFGSLWASIVTRAQLYQCGTYENAEGEVLGDRRSDGQTFSREQQVKFESTGRRCRAVQSATGVC